MHSVVRETQVLLRQKSKLSMSISMADDILPMPDDPSLASQEEATRPIAMTSRPSNGVHVLILVALQDELEALLSIEIDGSGREAWSEECDLSGFRYYRRRIFNRLRETIEVATAWIGEMGQRSAAIRGQQLLVELDPSCLAMCGICAGYREKVGLGDIIVAERLYAYDEGKRITHKKGQEEFFHSLRSFDLEATWKMDASFLAREIDLTPLQQERPPSKEAQRKWLLHTQYAHETQGKEPPAQHPERPHTCPQWSVHIKSALAEQLLERKGRELRLSDKGRDAILEDQLLYPDGLPKDPALRIHSGAVATGSAVVEDPGIFTRLRKYERNTIALEMEGTAIGELAQRFKKQAILIKAVQDFADGSKDDAYRPFGCKASAWFLLHFLKRHFEPEQRTAEKPRAHREKTERYRFEALERRHPFLEKVTRLMEHRYPGAQITPHRTEFPFAGVLEVECDEGGIQELRLVGAIDQNITPELIRRFIEELETPYRIRDPLLRSILIHTGNKAPLELARNAYRHGVKLQSFYEAQGLFDLSPYLERQTQALEQDERYLPSIYVDQPASIELQGNRERISSESILETLLQWLDDQNQARFALVLGDFGAGKTFLLREVCRRMVREKHPVWPVLVEMGRLEKQNSLKELMAAHFAKYDIAGYSFAAFDYMLSEGRIALIFDGYDELALRVDYDSAIAHFETVAQAVKGHAKVVLSSRRHYFLTDGDIKTAIKRELAKRAEEAPGYRLVMLEPFGEKQIRRYLRNVLMEEKAAEDRYRLIHDVKDLMGLSENPRMLSFIAKLPEGKLREAKKEKGEIKSADLYEVLVKDWLDFEHQRANPPGAPHGISRKALEIGIENIARWLWHERQGQIGKKELEEELAAVAAGGGKHPLSPGVVAQMFGSGSLLVRDKKPEEGEGRFSFVHRSIMEWFLARLVAETIRGGGNPDALKVDEISLLMADFLWAMAGRENAVAWARRILKEKGEGYEKKNAALVLTRLKVPLSDINLEGQDLRGRDFSGVDWRYANLAFADLRGATLAGADLSGAILSGANLVNANLEGAKLCDTTLDETDFSHAKLMGVDFTGARLMENAKWTGAKLMGAKGEMFTPEWQAYLHRTFGAAPPSLDGVQAVPDVEREVPFLANSPCMAYSPGANLAAWASDNAIAIFDLKHGRLVRHFSEAITRFDLGRAIAVNQNGSVFAVAEVDHKRFDVSIRLFDVQWRTRTSDSKGHQLPVGSIAFHPNRPILASASKDQTVRLWNTNSGRCQRILEGHQGSVNAVAFNHDGSSLASGSDDNTIRIWDPRLGTCQRILEGHQGSVNAVAFDHNSSYFVSASADNTVRLWDIGSGKCHHVFHAIRNMFYGIQEILSVAFNHDGSFLATSSRDKTASLWDTRSGNCTRILQGHRGPVICIAFSPSGTRLITGSADHTIRMWSTASGECLAVIVPFPEGWVAYRPRDGRYRCEGKLDFDFYHTVGRCRFELGELDLYIPNLRLADDEPLVPDDW